jgi:Ca-activated chloride channel family protein
MLVLWWLSGAFLDFPWSRRMFGFAHPEWLTLALLVPFVIWWWLKRRRPSLRYSDVGFLTGLPAGRRRRAVWTGVTLRAAGLLLLVIALAGPRWADPSSRLSTEGIAIEILVDVSGSMGEKDFEWDKKHITRLEAVKKVFQLFVRGGTAPQGERLDGRPNDLIGLITFATRPTIACPLTLSHDVLLQMLVAEEPRTVPGESRTNIGDAIAWGVNDLRKARQRRRIMVLFTDGEHNVDPPRLKPRQAAQLAAAEGIPIYAIDAGSDLPGPETEKEGITRSAEDRANAVKVLRAISETMTDGRYFRAQDTQSLLDVCRQIDRLEKEKIESFQYRYYREGYAWAGLASLLFLVVAYLLDWTIWLKVM